MQMTLKHFKNILATVYFISALHVRKFFTLRYSPHGDWSQAQNAKQLRRVLVLYVDVG